MKKKVRRETKGEKVRRIEAGGGRDKRRRSGESEFMCERGGGEIKEGMGMVNEGRGSGGRRHNRKKRDEGKGKLW